MLFSIITQAQIYNPLKWKTSIEKISDTEYELQAKAIIESGWHLYSQEVSDGGPIPTRFTFTKAPEFQLIGAVKEEKGKKRLDVPLFVLTGSKTFSGAEEFSYKTK